MNKKNIITIAGKPGSGKSTASKSIAQELGFEHFSSGDLFRAIGRERGAQINEANELAEKEKDIDELVDQRLRDIGASQNQVIIDSRMAWHWMPQSFKVYLNLDLEVAALRILSDMDDERRKHEHIPKDPAEYAKLLKSRLDSEARRYKKLYDVNPYDVNNYDLVVNTADHQPKEVQELIMSEYNLWLGLNSSTLA